MFFKNKTFWLILFCIQNILLFKEESDDKLLFVLEHFRHGARGPYKSFDYDNWEDLFDVKWNGSGELTSLGMRMHYLLGVAFRNKYKDFISNEYNPNEIFVISTDLNRTIMSAYSNLLGTFYNSTKTKKMEIDDKFILNKNYSEKIKNTSYEFKNDVFPVHFFKEKDLSYQLYRTEICPGFETFLNKIKNSENLQNMYKDTFKQTNERFGKYLTKYIDQEIIDKQDYYSYYKKMKNICDTFIADYFDNRNIKDFEGINLKDFNEHCLNISLIVVYYDYYGYPSEKSVEFGVSPTFRQIFDYMDKRINLDINGDSDKIIASAPKFVIISGHDVSLAAFDLFFKDKFNVDFKRADFANNQIFELWKSNGKYYIKYLINLNTSLSYDYYEFRDEVSKLLYKKNEIKEICENNNSKKLSSSMVLLLFILILL